MTKVKVFVYRRQQQQRGYDNSSPDLHHGELTKQTLNAPLPFYGGGIIRISDIMKSLI